MDSGGIGRALLGIVILSAVVAFVVFGYDAEQVDERGDPVLDATARPVATAVLEEPQPAATTSEASSRIEDDCRDLFYAEPQCAGVVANLCAEVGQQDQECLDAVGALCATSLAAPICPTPDAP